MFNNKKGAELPMNTIIIAIVAVVVLVIIIVFFIGGTSSVAQKIKEIFSGATAGTDIQLATQFCKEYCDQGRTSTYCQKTFNVDKDSNPNTPPIIMKCGTESKVKDKEGNELDTILTTICSNPDVKCI